MSSITLPNPVDSNEDCQSDEYCIIVYNNDVNTFQEVIAILCLALQIDRQRAEMHAWDVHLLGSARVHYGSETDCQSRAEIISKIGIRTEVCSA